TGVMGTAEMNTVAGRDAPTGQEWLMTSLSATGACVSQREVRVRPTRGQVRAMTIVFGAAVGCPSTEAHAIHGAKGPRTVDPAGQEWLRTRWRATGACVSRREVRVRPTRGQVRAMTIVFGAAVGCASTEAHAIHGAKGPRTVDPAGASTSPSPGVARAATAGR